MILIKGRREHERHKSREIYKYFQRKPVKNTFLLAIYDL